MATRMQQRRGTAQQWTDADPILAAGEIGFETDTNQFKIGDGVNAWSDLSYFKNLEDLGGSLDDYALANLIGAANGIASLDGNGQVPIAQLGNIIDGAPELLNTINELAEAINDNATFANTVLTSVDAAQQAAEGYAEEYATNAIANAIALEVSNRNNAISVSEETLGQNISDSFDTLSNNLANHAADDSNVHGIANTLALATKTYADDQASYAQGNAEATAASALSDHNSETFSVHGIANTAALVTATQLTGFQTYIDNLISSNAQDYTDSAILALTKSSVGLGDVDNTSDADKPVSTATQTALDLKANLAGPTFTGTTTANNLVIDGDLTLNGNTFTASATSITIEDNMVQLAHQNSGNTVDLGLVVSYNDGQTAYHAGLVRDVSDAKWKLFDGVTTEPTTTVNFGQGSLDALAVGALEATTVTPSSGVVFTDGTQTKEGVVSRTPIISKTASYTLSELTERDSLIEVASSSATTLTIPANSAVAFPVGTSIDVLQTSTGQVTIAGAAGVTVNATPGLKLRTQWSGVTLFKRATDTWVVYGDLSA